MDERQINFEKVGVKFRFFNPHFDEHNYYRFDYSISNMENGKHFVNAKLSYDKKQISVYGLKINGKEYSGVNLFEEDVEKIKIWYEKDLEIRKKNIKQMIDKLVSGEIKIEWDIVGCDYPEYQPWIKNIDEFTYYVQDIMQAAALEIYKSNNLGDYISGTICEFLEKNFKQKIGTIKDMNKVAENFKFNKDRQNYFGYEDNIVTSFETTLSDGMNLKKLIECKKINDEKEKAEKDRISELFKKAKETGEKQEINHWFEDCNDPKEECNMDYVYVYAMPDGTQKTMRYHTY